MSERNKPAKPSYLAGHFLDPYWHAPKVDGVLESSIGDRSGEAFKGRCYKGDGVASVDCSGIVSGTMTAKCGWFKSAGGEFDVNNLTYEEYVTNTEPKVDITDDTVAGTSLVLESDTKYHWIWIYDNGVVVGKYTCEEGFGVTLYDVSGNENHLTVVNYDEETWHDEDSDIPFSFLNEEGYSPGPAVDFGILNTYTDFDNIIDVTNAAIVQASQILWIAYGSNTSHINCWIRNKRGVSEYLDLDGIEYQPGITPKSNMGGFYDDNDGRGYYITAYGELNTPITLRDFTSGLDSADYSISVYTESEGNFINLRNNDYLNEMNSYCDNVYNGVYGVEGSTILVPNGVFYTYNSFKDWYDFLKTQNREDEVDSRVMKYWPGFTFDDHYNAALAAWGGTIPDNSQTRTFYAWQLGRKVFIPSGHVTIEDDILLCINPTTTNQRVAAFVDGRTMGEVDLVDLGIGSNPTKCKFYTEGFGVFSKVKVPLNANLNNSRDKIGKVRQSLQLKQSYCLKGDGIWSLTYPAPVTSVFRGTEDITSKFAIASGNITPEPGLELYDLTINGDAHYPCAEGVSLTIFNDAGEDGLPIINTVNPWDFQDVYHWNAFKGIWQSTVDRTLFATYQVDVNYERFLGLEATRSIPIGIESKIQFPDAPEIVATNIDPTKQYSIDELINKNVPSTFSELKGDRLSNILSYNLVVPGEFSCFNMSNGESISFLNTTNWDSFTHQGTGDFSLDLVGNKLDCISDGTIFNLKIFDVNGVLIKHFPIVFGSGTIAYEVIDSTQHATLPNSAGWDFQNIYNYNGVYGSFNSEPAKYAGRIKRSSQTVLGNQINNQSELKTKGDITFKAMAFTKSDL